MTIKYTKEQLNKFDKDLLIELFLGMQGQMEELSRQTQALNDRMQLMMEQMVLFQKNRFGRSSEKWRILNRYVSWKWTGLSYSLMKQRQSATWMHRNLMT